VVSGALGSMMLTDNLDVENGLANGSMCNVREVILSDGITYQNLEKIQIDGYYVWCAVVSQVREIKLQLQEGDMRVISKLILLVLQLSSPFLYSEQSTNGLTDGSER
jgi:hypothetical protein